MNLPPDDRARLRLSTYALVVGVLAWLWPIGLGGRMPVGGDVTQFSMGLMAVLHEALRHGRLPLWNDLWGYGFPGLAESQMGVYYPPHLFLYLLLGTEAAYTASLLVHTVWGALGAAWAARRFGVTAWGSALAGFTWATCGFALVHLPHQWSYTAGSWMPWAWGLAWTLLSGHGCWRTAVNLAVVLCLQLLPGHFQLAFFTQVSLLVMGLWMLFERRRPAERIAAARALGTTCAILAFAFALAALQLWPTLQLARIASSKRDFEYLSGFAAMPLHLVSYLSPGLFHRSPLWRPIAWDPFHTSPEEHLAYVGLVPLCLALGAMRLRWRGEPATRVLVVLAGVTLVLSLGPYVPGFRFWYQWPGFSFFRAPARWSMATALALAILAGKGFDALPDWPRVGRSLLRFALVVGLVPALVIGGFELALVSTEGAGLPPVAGAFSRALRALPWEGDPSFAEVMATARRPQTDFRVQAALAREGFPAGPNVTPRLSRDRLAIYVTETWETAVLAGALVVTAALAGNRKRLALALAVLTTLDLLALARHRPIDTAPLRPLVAQSPALAALAADPRGERVISSLRNMPMVAGSAPLSAYRTLDIKVLEDLTALAHGVLGHGLGERPVLAAMRATASRVRVVDPIEALDTQKRVREARPGEQHRVMRDPALASWLFGTPWVATPAGQQATTFTLWWPSHATSRAWLVDGQGRRSLAALKTNTGEPGGVLEVMRGAEPLQTRSSRPERFEVEVPQSGAHAVVVLSQLYDPQWQAHWVDAAGVARPAQVVRVFGGWQAVELPEGAAGARSLRLFYRARDAEVGLAISAVAWLALIVACSWRLARKRKRRAHTGGEAT